MTITADATKLTAAAPTPAPASGPRPTTDLPSDRSPARGRRFRWQILAGLAALLIVAAGAWKLLGAPANVDATPPAQHVARPTTRLLRSPSPFPLAPAPAPDSATAVLDGQLKVLMPQLEAFVATTRGLNYLHPVTAVLLPEGAFEAKLASLAPAPTPTDKADAATAEAELQALGFVPPGTDLSAKSSAIQADVDGLYDFQTKQLYVKGTAFTPYVRSVLVHELTHALDDQHFDLGRISAMTGNDEEAGSFRALAEGDAVHVQDAYIKSMSPADQAQARGDSGGNQPSSGQSPTSFGPSDPLADAVAYPYVGGYYLVDALIAAGGQDYVNRAFGAPPSGSMQVLQPDYYLRSIRPVVLDPPRPAPLSGYTVVDTGTMGQLWLFLMLEENLDPVTAGFVSSTWAGDGFVAMHDSAGNTCVRVEYEADSTQDQPLLVAGLKKWAGDHDAVVEYAGVVFLTACTGGTPHNP